MFAVAITALTRSGSDLLMFTACVVQAATSAYDFDRSRHSRYSGGETQNLSKPSFGN
jgi:hypothetical protein